MTDVKFCGLTRAVDASFAAELGASYVGVIFAGGPREITPDHAAAILAPLPPHVQRVGVFGSQTPNEVVDIARSAALDVVQLHGDFSSDAVQRLRDKFNGKIWIVARSDASRLPVDLEDRVENADAVLLDRAAAGTLGGTGKQLDWIAIAPDVTNFRARTGTAVVLAGGLRPENVARAIDAIRPDAVDVSSGVETRPGIKDHEQMRAFARAAGLMEKK